MTPIKASEIHLYQGHLVRVVYVKDRGLGTKDGSLAFIVDDMITPPVVLKGYNSQTQEAEVERAPGSPVERIKIKEIFASL